MGDLNLYLKLSILPSAIKAEVLDYMDFLVTKKLGKKTQIKKHPKAGCMKGTFKMHPNFDEPLDDFKEYR